MDSTVVKHAVIVKANPVSQ